jgi:hypothetical protein
MSMTVFVKLKKAKIGNERGGLLVIFIEEI